MNNFKFKIGGRNYTTCVNEQPDGTLLVTVNDKTYQVDLPERSAASHVHLVRPVAAPSALGAAPVAAPACACGGGSVSAPLPGTVTKVLASVGQKVHRGEVLVVMEAMKMENDIVAENDGVVTAVNVTVGQSVNQGDVMVKMDVPAAPSKTVSAPAAAPVAPATPVAAPGTLTAPLPGTVTKILVQVGQEVKSGDTVLLMEAMKMENSITAEASGKVKAILVQAGAQVQSGQALVEME